MRTHKIALSGLVAALALSGLALTGTGCAGTRYERSTGTYLDDKSVSARVKTALFRDPDVSGFDVNVNTFRGDVQLSGFVDTAEQKQRAGDIAREVSGVQMVTNNIEIKPAGTAVGSSGSAVQSGTVTQPAPVRSSGSGTSLDQQWRPVQGQPTQPSDLNRNTDMDINRGGNLNPDVNRNLDTDLDTDVDTDLNNQVQPSGSVQPQSGSATDLPNNSGSGTQLPDAGTTPR